MPQQTYQVTVTLQGTQRQIAGPPSSITQAGSDFDKIQAARKHGGPVDGVAWFSLLGRNLDGVTLGAVAEVRSGSEAAILYEYGQASRVPTRRGITTSPSKTDLLARSTTRPDLPKRRVRKVGGIL